jgi:hypothetical protein
MDVEQLPFCRVDRTLFFDRYQRRGMPVLLRNAVDTKALTFQHLSERLSDQVFVARSYGHNASRADKRTWRIFAVPKPLRFKRYVTMLDAGEAKSDDIYMAAIPLDRGNIDLSALQKIGEVLGLPAKLGPFGPFPFSLWCGPGGHLEPLHYDDADGTLIQVWGTKKVTLFPVSESANLYPFSINSAVGYWFSQVNTRFPDFTAFPRFRKALSNRYDVTLDEGDCLFIPRGWWHEVEAFGGTVCSINRFWIPRPFHRMPFFSLRYITTMCGRAAYGARNWAWTLTGAKRTIFRTAIVTADGERLAETLTDAAHLSRWFVRNSKRDGDTIRCRAGAWNLSARAMKVNRSEVAWQFAQTSRWPGTTVRFGFNEQPDGVLKVSLNHRVRMSPAHGMCAAFWAHALDSLVNYIETGKGMPFLD